MNIGFVVVMALLLAALFYVRNSRSTSVRSHKRVNRFQARAAAEERQWHAVELHAGNDCCDSIAYVQDKVFLAGEAPALPLSSCTQVQCRCTYEHFDDRRRELRRDPYSQYGLLASQHEGDERRNSRGRRVTDLSAA